MPFDTSQPHPELLLELVSMRMPFGKYKDRLLCDLPDHYLEWFQRQGFPKGKLGILLETMYVIRLNGLSYLLNPFKKKISVFEFIVTIRLIGVNISYIQPIKPYT